MSLPPGAVPFTQPQRRILAHLLAGGDPTMRTLTRVADRSLSTVHATVWRLAQFGLVDWTDRQATLHPTCIVVPLRGSPCS